MGTGRGLVGPRLATWMSFFPQILPMMPMFPAGLYVHSITLLEHMPSLSPKLRGLRPTRDQPHGPHVQYLA